MGNSNFFAKIASMDPLAQALNLPGAHKYAQAQAQSEAGRAGASGGPYTGVAPTLAGANAGYSPGGPGSTVGWSQYVAHDPSNFFQKAANLSGNLSAQPINAIQGGGGVGAPDVGAGTSNPYVQQNTVRNPYVTAARGATQQNTWGG